MKKCCVLISGSTIAGDEELQNALQQSADVIKNSDNSQIESIIKKHKVDLILLEMLKGNGSEIDLIKNLRFKFPKIAIVVIDGDGDQDKLAKVFHYGVKDAFRKPYKCDLIVERIEALLRVSQFEN